MANPEEARLHYPFADRLPAPGEVIEVRPGILWARLPLPFALDRINVWLLRDHVERNGVRTEGWCVVDCGVDRPEVREQWQAIWANHLQGLPIVRVLATHMHPDHIGLAHWICDEWRRHEGSCDLWMSATDFHLATLGTLDGTGFGGHAGADFMASHGMADATLLDGIRTRQNGFKVLVPKMPSHFHRLMGGMQVRIGEALWNCIVGHGHSPEHISLFQQESGVLISGDMVLPRISTNVSVYSGEPEGNPLQQFLDSLTLFEQLPHKTLVLPSHGKPFGAAPDHPEEHGLHERIRQLRRHHDEHLVNVLQSCAAEAQHAADILPVLFKRKLNAHETSFAIGEAIAHLHLLWLRGDLQRRRDATGVWRFSAA